MTIKQFAKWHPSRLLERKAPKHHCMASQIHIYLLVDPRDSTARYAGVTNDPERRLARHLETPTNRRLARWITGMQPLRPLMVIVGKASAEKWQTAEQAWISWLRRQGDCYNIADGGTDHRAGHTHAHQHAAYNRPPNRAKATKHVARINQLGCVIEVAAQPPTGQMRFSRTKKAKLTRRRARCRQPASHLRPWEVPNMSRFAPIQYRTSTNPAPDPKGRRIVRAVDGVWKPA